MTVKRNLWQIGPTQVLFFLTLTTARQLGDVVENKVKSIKERVRSRRDHQSAV